MPIEAVYVAALDVRRDMVEDLEAQVHKYLGLPLNKFWSGHGCEGIRYDRIDMNDASAYSSYGSLDGGRSRHGNAFLSHKALLQRVLDEGYKNILLLEEDIFFVEDRWNTIFPQKEVQNLIDDDGCQALYLGWQAKAYCGDSDDLNEVEAMWKEDHWCVQRVANMYNNLSGLHAVVLKRSLIERLVKLESGPIDTYLGKNVDRFNMYYVCPKIIGSLASYSNAQACWQNRSVLI